MPTSQQVDPSEPDWDGHNLDLDAIGLATEFAEHVRREGIPPAERPQALGAWLDSMIADLEADLDDERPRP
ncbi:hypothetical protein [Jiangella mangrovi]|uniref:Uncharacterized protein n=1 Tax=Jiangella mangrovi TaxID=1524084 RepID=A0A7W9GUA3_9ACTN|nr:hypothetical protein [Jiangella mangrovi]MBB5790160.1 hypothetical protein [Jiangella mangrovi]